jgi:hypothetical protein
MLRSMTLLLLISILLGACQTTTPAPIPTQPEPTASHTATPSLESTAPVGADDESSSASCPPIEGDTFSEMHSIETEVSQLRGFQPLHPVERRLFTADQLRTYVLEEFLADYTAQEAKADAKILFMLGLLPEILDLRQLYTDLFSEQIAGFYDTENDEMVVVCESGFSGVERLTYAHEFVHALQDQHFGFETGLAYSDTACEDSSQRCAATQALFEGDATLLQEQWLRRFARAEDLEDLALFFSSFTMPIYESAPHYVQADFTFPYLEGLFFVRSLYLKDGWASVDDAFLNLPQSTEQILHPERYPWDNVVTLEIPDLSPLSEHGWEIAYQDVLGEWTLLKMLEVYLPESEASLAAEGWGGDFVILLDNPDLGAQAVIQLIQWDSMRDAHEFTAAYQDYGEMRYGEAVGFSTTRFDWASGDIHILFERHSNQTLIIQSTSEDLQAIRDALTLPVRALP